MTREPASLVLASGSATRRAMLSAAGINVTVQPADVDESAVRDALLSADPSVSHEVVALALAEAKAKAVSRSLPGALVIGADQVLSLDGHLFEKPQSVAEARQNLWELRGKSHALHSAVALAQDGLIVWHDADTAVLTMRKFTEAALDAYLDRVGDVVLTSVGAYQIEGPAIQLFEVVDGDHATILGMPLLPLIAELRRREVLVS
jgi:septum formation protein